MLVGADVRHPKLFMAMDEYGAAKEKNIQRRSAIGLTHYLVDPDITIDDILNRAPLAEAAFDVIYSGKIPPNPAEVLMSERLEELLGEASKRYDYVILDSAPVLVVADTLTFTRFADETIYVMRAGVTENKVLAHARRLEQEGKLKNLSFVVNGVSKSLLGYGDGYGYGYHSGSRKKKKR